MQFPSASQGVLAVARINADGVTLLGTAFSVARGKFATTKHVTGGNDTGLVLILNPNPSFLDYQDTSPKNVNYATARIAALDAFRDICILEIDDNITPGYPIGGTDEVPPGTLVVSFGFPHMDTGRWVLTQHETNVGARILMEVAPDIKTKQIVLNTQARPGQSGSPVFTFGNGNVRLVAMVIGAYAPGHGGSIIIGNVDPATLHQTTHAISAEYLKGMI